jgi:hypothetical protein
MCQQLYYGPVFGVRLDFEEVVRASRSSRDVWCRRGKDNARIN